MLPENAFFAPPLKIRALDTRYGGLSTPVVGQGTVDLSRKIPWSETYEAPCQQPLAAHESTAEAAGAIDAERLKDHGGAEEAKGQGESKGDEEAKLDAEDKPSSLAVLSNLPSPSGEAPSPPPPPSDSGAGGAAVTYEAVVDDVLAENVLEGMGLPDGDFEDSGAGVFGAVKHLDEKLARTKKRHELRKRLELGKGGVGALADASLAEDFEDEGPPKYMIDREVYKGAAPTWEDKMETTPFETYALFIGKDERRKQSCLFKGLIRISESEDAPPIMEEDKLQQLLKPQQYKLRLYVLKATQLAARDQAFMGRPGRSDPYILVRLGNNLYNDRENFVSDVDEADLYKLIEFDCELPGAGRLDVALMDHDDFGSDDLIGRTVIDLEDRWFDERWQKVGEQTYDPDAEGGGRWYAKPLENRPLFMPTSALPQGNLECWVDILEPGEAAAFAPDDVALPPEQKFEVRVVFWKTAKVPAADTLGGQNMTDMYARVHMEGCDPQETDTHWRAKKGKGSFNWRLKFPVVLSNRSRTMKFPYLHVELWDKDVVKWNDMLGSTQINLGRFLRRAYKKRNQVIKVFDDREKERLAKQNTLKERLKRGVGASDATKNPMRDVALDEEEEDDDEAGEADDGAITVEDDSTERRSSGGLFGMKKKPYSSVAAASPRAKGAKDEGYEGMEMSPRARDAARKKAMAEREKERLEAQKLQEEAEEEDDEEDEDEEDVDPDEEAEKQQLDSLLNNARSMLGWDIDPPDSCKIDFECLERDGEGNSKRRFMGHGWISVEIWPDTLARGFEAGTGRSDPNDNPYLPPPVGRLQFSLNPFYMMMQICGPSLMCKFLCCIFCLGLLALLIFCQPVINFLIAVFV